MQIVPTQGLPQSAPTTATATAPVVGPATPAAPMEPARRVTANREGGRGDLQTQQQPQRASTATPSRGRLIDMSV